MKIKLSLLLIIIGIIIIDISCNRRSEKKMKFDVVGIDNIQIFQRNSKGGVDNPKDTIAYDSLTYLVNFKEKQISFNTHYSLINGAYAALPETFEVDWELDSIKIFSVRNTFKTDLTTQFSVAYNFGDTGKIINNTNPEFIKQFLTAKHNTNFRLCFSLNTAPAKAESMQFSFQFFDKKGRMFEKMSEAVVITPLK